MREITGGGGVQANCHVWIIYTMLTFSRRAFEGRVARKMSQQNVK